MEGEQSSLVTLSSARGQVLNAVKRRGETSADEVAKSLGITPSAVRQHLATLKSGGLVASRQERGRSGRPTDLYHTTELGETLFGGPSTVDLTVELLGFVEDEDPELVTRVFERRQRERVAQCQGQLADKSLAAKVAGLAEILDAEGYMADVDPLPETHADTSPLTMGARPACTVTFAPPSISSSTASLLPIEAIMAHVTRPSFLLPPVR